MKLIFTVFIVNFALVSVNAEGLKIEANHGEDVILPFTMDKAEKAEQLKITFTSETTKTHLIARHCVVPDNCVANKTDGVKLLVGQGFVNVTIQKVNRSKAGLYEVDLVGKDMPEVNPITLVVNDASPNCSNLFGLCALIPLVISVGHLLL